ncbi:hypothetical protein JTB14_020108 [Gonioctena quinquepunctata]|nr:hypothetical protein JTB14_020108 [Gonioctena quinquepunctata]
MDGYEVDNLISENFSDRNRGFIAYSAIKPPVEIEFEFICPINIHFIKLDTVVGSQKCSGIEIYAKSRSSSYTSICRSVFNKAGVYFCNSRKYSKVTPPDGFNENNELAFFKSNTFKCFLDAASIKVVIFRTEKSVPCLGSVDVWGTVSKSCSAVTANTIKRLVSKAEMPKINSESTELDEFKIPEDFKDELTYEIMTVPMTLPSGKTVDQSTLEKHIQSEISFSRKPCDPFTGIKFTDKLKPLVNLALKSRIDMFVLQNSQRPEFSNMGRTLGRNNSSNGSQRGMENDTNKRKRDRSENSLDEAISKSDCSKVGDEEYVTGIPDSGQWRLLSRKSVKLTLWLHLQILRGA